MNWLLVLLVQHVEMIFVLIFVSCGFHRALARGGCAGIASHSVLPNPTVRALFTDSSAASAIFTARRPILPSEIGVDLLFTHRMKCRSSSLMALRMEWISCMIICSGHLIWFRFYFFSKRLNSSTVSPASLISSLSVPLATVE